MLGGVGDAFVGSLIGVHGNYQLVAAWRVPVIEPDVLVAAASRCVAAPLVPARDVYVAELTRSRLQLTFAARHVGNLRMAVGMPLSDEAREQSESVRVAHTSIRLAVRKSPNNTSDSRCRKGTKITMANLPCWLRPASPWLSRLPAPQSCMPT